MWLYILTYSYCVIFFEEHLHFLGIVTIARLDSRSTTLQTNIAMENEPFIPPLPIKMVLFHSYVKLPEAKAAGNPSRVHIAASNSKVLRAPIEFQHFLVRFCRKCTWSQHGGRFLLKVLLPLLLHQWRGAQICRLFVASASARFSMLTKVITMSSVRRSCVFGMKMAQGPEGQIPPSSYPPVN